MKRQLLTMLTMLICMVSAHAQSFEVDGISYNVTKAPDGESPGEVEVTGGEIKEEIEFPETVTYDGVTYTVTSIGGGAFRSRYDSQNFTRKYVIPGTVRSIGNDAFYDNYYLEEVELNKGLQKIGNAAFGYNFELREIRIPSTVTSIGNDAFCTNQQNRATISCLAATPPAIESSTFAGRTSDPLHVTIADVDAYKEAENWKDFSEIIGDIVFRDRCYSPTFTINDGILTMSCMTEGATIYYTTDGSIPDENAIRYTAPISYNNNQIISAIAMAEGYENSAVRTFYDKDHIESITNFIDEQGINYTLVRADDNRYYYSVTGHSEEMSSEIVIPDNLNGCPVRNIEHNVFDGCTNLFSITISNSVINIGERAFQHCNNLTSVTLGEQLKGIGRYAFNNCGILSSIIIPNSVTSLGEFAFYNCSGLTSVTIGNSITTLKAGTFENCI